MKSKTWSIVLLSLSLATLILFGSVTAIIDPFFHYHAPLEALQYPIDDQRYQNDGIVRHFDYDAIITGTSLTENFKASQFDQLFDRNSVKVCFSGSTYQELNNNLRRAFASNPNIRTVLMAIDGWFLFEEPGSMRTDAEFPLYLYDDNPFNDVKYLLNKQVLCSRTARVLEYTSWGEKTTNFDDYSFWGNIGYGETGRDIALANSPRAEKRDSKAEFSQDARQKLIDNMTNNAIALAKKHPDVQFLYFFPPYSILYWDLLIREQEFDRQLEGWQLASQLLLEQENIQLYSFYTDFETVTNLDNYRDNVHYGDAVNALLLERMAKGEYRLTKETSDAHWQQVRDFYSGYDYDAIYS